MKFECNNLMVWLYLLCSVIGAIVIALGFYAVLWGKTKEEKLVENRGVHNSESPPETTTPLLANNVMDP